MNYDAKPYLFSSPMATIPLSRTANLSSPFQIFPIKFSQGMIQTQPANQYKQLYYTSPPLGCPAPHPPWVCNVQPTRVPSMATIPFIDGQPMIPSFRKSNLPPQFCGSMIHKSEKVEPEQRVQSCESSFEVAALRNGIRVEESPQKAEKENMTYAKVALEENKTGASHKMLFDEQEEEEEDSLSELGILDHTYYDLPSEPDERKDTLLSFKTGIDLSSRRISTENWLEDKKVDKTCSGHTPLESCKFITKTSSDLVKQTLKSLDTYKVNKLEAFGTIFDEPTGAEGHRGQQTSDFNISLPLSDEGNIEPEYAATKENAPQLLMVLSSQPTNDEPTLNKETADKNQIIAVGQSESTDSSNDVDILIDNFVQNVIFSVVNSLLQERGVSRSVTEFTVNNDGSTFSTNEEMRNVFVKLGSGKEIKRERLPLTINYNQAEPIPNLAESTPNPAEPIPNLAESTPNPAAPILNPAELIPNRAESMMNAAKPVLNLAEPIRNLIEPIPFSAESMTNTSKPALDPAETMPSTAEGLSPTKNYNPAESIPLVDSTNEERINSPEDQEMENLFVKLALKKGIKVGRFSPTNGGEVERVSLLGSSRKGSVNSPEDSKIDDLFVRLALEKGIKVGCVSPSNEISAVPQDYLGAQIAKDFKRLALRNGIRVGKSPLSAKLTSSRTTVEKAPKSGDQMDVFERLAQKNGIKIGTAECDGPFPPLNLPTAVLHDPVNDGEFYSNVVPPLDAYNRIQYNSQVKFDKPNFYSLSGQIDWINNNEQGYRKNTPSKLNSFEELAKKHGIKIGETFKTKIEVQTQTTKNSLNSQETQTCGAKVRNASVQVEASKEAFKAEYDEWMQEELSSIEPTASSFRELFLIEEEARTEAERRLAVEMDENVKAQRNTKMLIDELKEQLANREETIEKMNKEFKSAKKQKDNEIKRLTKEIKQKDEDLKTTAHDNSLKDVVIESMKDIVREQDERMKKMEEKLKEMENDVENKRKIAENLLKLQSAKDVPQQHNTKDEWQTVKGRYSSGRTAAKSKSLYHKIDCLSGFDDEDYNQRIERSTVRAPEDSHRDTITSQGKPYEEIQSNVSLTNKSCGLPRKDSQVSLGEVHSNITSEMEIVNNRPSVPGAYAPLPSRQPCPGNVSTSLPPPGGYATLPSRQSCPGTVTTSLPPLGSFAAIPSRQSCPGNVSTSLPTPGVYAPHLPREPCPGTVSTSLPPPGGYATLPSRQSCPGNVSTSLPTPGVCAPQLPKEPRQGAVSTSLPSPAVNFLLPSTCNNNTAISTSNPVCTNDITVLTTGIVKQSASNGSYPAFPYGTRTTAIPRGIYPCPANVAYGARLRPPGVNPYPVSASDAPLRPPGVNPYPVSASDAPLRPPGITVEPLPRGPGPSVSTKRKTTNKFSSFDKLMEALRESFPDHSRPSLMVYLKKAKESFGNNGFKGKHISEIVSKVAQVINSE